MKLRTTSNELIIRSCMKLIWSCDFHCLILPPPYEAKLHISKAKKCRFWFIGHVNVIPWLIRRILTRTH
uniref:Ovule protein n=1 Tax=Heterorhabditis bacteriophora TaxID=37862 RepID=A0A1I7XRA2_HETBA